MRLWTLHPRYLDKPGLTALWREALLAQAVLLNKTRGYRFHPQLQRFRAHPRPLAAIASYLDEVRREACRRGYCFDARLVGPQRTRRKIAVTRGQLLYELDHLSGKLRMRAGRGGSRHANLARVRPHPLFRIVPGPVEPWERKRGQGAVEKAALVSF